MDTLPNQLRRLAPPPAGERLLGRAPSLWPQRFVPVLPVARRGRVRVEGKFFARDGDRLRVHGVTYGPFAPDAAGEPFPAPERVREDFARMRAAGIDSIRTYHVPPEWLLHLGDEEGMTVLVDVPWRKHLCFLDDRTARKEALEAVRAAGKRGAGHPSLFAYSIGNEIPADVVRWHGAGRVEEWLGELADACRQADPEALVTYASFPSTEYLEVPGLDFLTFNVYLHDREAFSRYLMRLQNQAGDRPLLLGEMGMDTLRHGEAAQATFLAGHLREALLLGAAGAYVFSWTDDWHTGGHPIEDWAFGITRADRTPKPAYFAVREVFRTSPTGLLEEAPPVSVVVCSYNGGSTLDQCLRSLGRLDYPDYEVILVDDGSTDNTGETAARFPSVRTLHQENRGLSAARNAGLQAARGEIIAYTDSDCFADPHWLTHLVYQFQRTGAEAVGGPNLTPEDGALAACVAASPGQPIHVLETDEIAEHIPGCNMAYRREALEAIGGFDPVYRKAGDDVDVCWRLQQAGCRIGFAPGAFVWHHRRQNPRTYLRQQAGYGEAEALLRLRHPEKFNRLGHGKWRGVLYGAGLAGLRIGERLYHRGRFGAGLFQTVYQPAPAHWAMLPGLLEWHAAAGGLALLWTIAPGIWPVPAAMLFLSFLVAGVQAAQARLEPRHDRPEARLLVACLSYAQPLVRAWWRYRVRFRRLGTPAGPEAPALPWNGACDEAYWSEEWRERVELLERVVTAFQASGWTSVVDGGWREDDLEVFCTPWTRLRLQTVQEEHGSGKRLIRLRWRQGLSEYGRVLAAGTAVFGAAALASHAGPAVAAAGGLAAATAWAWGRGTRAAGRCRQLAEGVAKELGLVRCGGGTPR